MWPFDLIWYPNTQQDLLVSGSRPESQTLQSVLCLSASCVSVCTVRSRHLFKCGFYPDKVFCVLFFMLTSDISFSDFWPLQLWIHQHVGMDAAVCRDPAVSWAHPKTRPSMRRTTLEDASQISPAVYLIWPWGFGVNGFCFSRFL